MTEASPSRWRPLRPLLAPRSMRTMILVSLLPFLVLPVISYIGYIQYRSQLLQQAASDLIQKDDDVVQNINHWQSTGADRINVISEDPDIANAALQVKNANTETNRNNLLATVLKKEPLGGIFSQMAIVDSTTNTIIHATTNSWIDQQFPLVGNTWTFPYTQTIYNLHPFATGAFFALVAAPIRSESQPTGFVLIGFLDTRSLSSILAATQNTPPDNYIYLANSQAGWISMNSLGVFQVQNLSQDQINVLSRLSIGSVSEYMNPFDTQVAGRMVQVLDSNTRLFIERNVLIVYAPTLFFTGYSEVLGIGIVAAIVMTTFFLWLFLVRPMAMLARATDRIVSGHLDESIPMYGTKENVQLASAFEKINRELRSISQIMGADGQITTRKVMTTADLTQRLAGVEKVDEVMKIVVNLVLEVLGFHYAAIYMIDEAGQFAVIREATGEAGERIKAQGQRFPLGSYTVVGAVAQTGQIHNAANIAEDPMYVRNDFLPDSRSEAAVPIRSDRRIVGVLDVHSNSGNAFSPEDLDLLQTIGAQAGMAIEHVQVVETANINTEVSQQLIRSSRLISMVSKPDDVYQAALDGLKGTSYILAILTTAGDHLEMKGFFDPSSPLMEKPPVSSINDPAEVLARLLPSSQPVVLKVLSELSRLPLHMRQFLQSLGCRMAAFLPLRQGDHLLGTILLASHDENTLTMTRVRAYMPVAEQILVAMERLDLIHSTQDRLNELVTLNRISQSISQALDVEELFASVQEQIRTAIGECDLIFALYEQNRDLLTFPFAFLGNQMEQLDPTPMSDSLYATVIRTGQPLMLVQDLEERAAALGVHIPPQSLKSWLGVPLVSSNQVVGVLTLQDTQKENRFNENDLRLVTTIGAQIASTIRTSTLLQESERKAVQLQTAAEIARETIGLLDLDRLLSNSVNLIRDRFGFYHSSVFLLDEDHKFAVLKESTGDAGRQMKNHGHKLEIGSQSIIGWVTQNARPRVADDVTADPMHKPNPLLPATRAELGIPMKIGDTVIGALDIQSTAPYAFTPDDIAILQVIADQITIAVENARLFSQTREYLTRHQSLYRVTASAAASTTVDNALLTVAQGLCTTMPGARVAIFLLNPEKDSLVIRAQVGFASKEVEKLRIPVGQGVPGWVVMNRQPSLVANTATDSRYLMIDSDVQSELSIPLMHREDLFGVLDIQSARSGAFSEDDVQLLGTVASSLSAILSSTILFEQVTQERERLRHLYEEAIGMAGPPAGSMDTLLRNAIERVRTVSGSDCVAIAFPTGPEEARIEMCTCEPHYHHLAGTVIQYGQDVMGKALATSQVVLYSPASGTGELSKTLVQAGVKSALALPLQWAGRNLGELLVSRMTSDRPFSNEETQLVSLLALQMAATIESARLFDQTRRQAEREHLLYEITSRIRRSVDVQGILSITASELSKALGARRATIKIGGAEGPSMNNGSAAENS